MATWSQFVTAAPRLAAVVRELFAPPDGASFGYLATVRADGGPRVHPVMPLVTGDGLHCFLVPSPKRRDLERDGRYALHALPGDRGYQEAYLTGTAVPVTDPLVVRRLAHRFRAAAGVDWRLFELHIAVAMAARSGPAYEIWHAPDRTGPRRGQLCGASAGQVE